MSMSDAFLPVDGPGRLDPDEPVDPDARRGIEPGDDEPDLLPGAPDPRERAEVAEDDPASATAGRSAPPFRTPEPGDRLHADDLRAEIADQ